MVQTVIQYSTTAIKHLATQLINFNAFKQAKGCAPMKDRTSSRGSFISSLSLSRPIVMKNRLWSDDDDDGHPPFDLFVSSSP
jgi:hypothetical protein